MYTVTQAIEQTVKARVDELSTGEQLLLKCPLCKYGEESNEKFPLDGFSPACQRCPIMILTGVYCDDHDKHYHHNNPQMGVSFALALQYYWEIYKKTGKTLRK